MRILPISRIMFKGSTPVDTTNTTMPAIHLKPEQPQTDTFTKSSDVQLPPKNGQE